MIIILIIMILNLMKKIKKKIFNKLSMSFNNLLKKTKTTKAIEKAEEEDDNKYLGWGYFFDTENNKILEKEVYV